MRGDLISSFSWYNYFMSVKLKDFQETRIYPTSFDTEIIPGTVLCVAQNTSELKWHGTTKTEWSNGNWKQYGIYAKSNTASSRHIIDFTVPQNETWQVLVRMSTGTVHPTTNQWSHSGIAYIQGASGTTYYATSSLTANGDLYLPQCSEVSMVLTAGKRYRFFPWVRTSGTGDCQWYGGGDTSSNGNNFNFGISCSLSVTLLKKS